MVLRNVIETNEEKPLFQLFFLKNDDDESIEVVEVEEIDFTEVKKRLERGESVFITRKRKQKLDLNSGFQRRHERTLVLFTRLSKTDRCAHFEISPMSCFSNGIALQPLDMPLCYLIMTYLH